MCKDIEYFNNNWFLTLSAFYKNSRLHNEIEFVNKF